MTYLSSNKKVVTVDKKGIVRITGTGRATITIKAPATVNYEAAELKVGVEIVPARQKIKTLKKTDGLLTVKWKRDKRATGYQIQYGTKKNFKKASKKTVTKKKATSGKLVSPVSGKKYYVRVRSYKTVKENGKRRKLYGAWSKAKTFKTR